jgi:hypothetical protein
MKMSAVARDFDHHMEVAYGVLGTSARRSPEIITKSREKELKSTLDSLYLPNIDFRGNAHVNVANRPGEGVAFLPFKASQFVKRLQVGHGGATTEKPFPSNLNGHAGMATFALADLHPDMSKARELTHSIIETTPKGKRETWHMLGSAMLHELTHVNQAFRPPSVSPYPKALAGRPILRPLDVNYNIRGEVETYWLQDSVSEPGIQERTRKRSERISELFIEGKDPREELARIDFVALMKSLTDLELIHADRNPEPNVANYLIHMGVVGSCSLED